MGKADADFVIRLKNSTYSIKNLKFGQGICQFCQKIKNSTYSIKNLKFGQGTGQFCHNIQKPMQPNLFKQKRKIHARQMPIH